MTWDDELAARLRATVAGRNDIDERPMFGALIFLAHGNMFAGVIGRALMVRVGRERYDDALGRPHARIMDFTGRPMRTSVFVDPSGITNDAELREWIDLGLAFVDTLPAK